MGFPQLSGPILLDKKFLPCFESGHFGRHSLVPRKKFSKFTGRVTGHGRSFGVPSPKLAPEHGWLEDEFPFGMAQPVLVSGSVILKFEVVPY